MDSSAERKLRYQNWRLLGRGGTATVFRVFDAELQYDVAVKVLNKSILSDRSSRDVMLKSMRGEVVISRMLRHENICPVHDLYEGPEGFGIVMDIVDGCELRDWMNEHDRERLATAAVRLELLRKLASALALAHTRIVHRDLKPSNIFLRGGDIVHPVIMDFGFAVVGQRVENDSSMAFTPMYAAPEQFERPNAVDRRADLWALGIMAYELFTGRLPPCSLRHVLKERKVPNIPIDQIEPVSSFNAAVPASLDRLIRQLLSYDPDRRIQTADDLLSVLSTVELVSDPLAVSVGSGSSARREAAVRVDPGDEYYLGARAGGKTRPNELPARPVMLTPFLIDPYPVTNADYVAFATATGYPLPPFSERRIPNFGQHPVVGVTYDEAMAYARWAGGVLPTEAQWECAARGGVRFAEYPWGDDPPGPTRANIDGVSDQTTPIRSFSNGVNPFGLGDLIGNVWEWCLDSYEPDFYRTLAKGAVNPVNLRKTAEKVIRGGSFQSFAAMGRCAFRASARPDERRNDLGFRVAYKIETS